MKHCGILLDERYRRHLTGPGHPERPERLDAIRSALLENGLLDACERLSPPLVSERQLLRVHTAAYLTRLRTACEHGARYVDSPDCAISQDSYEIARLAAGGVVKACRMVADGRLKRAFCAVRPPGHHAEPDMAMGFCFYNNVAIAARAIQDDCGVERILIFDFDVHHGNATQHYFEEDPSVLYISMHGDPLHLFPHTGFADEIGVNEGRGYTLNIPFRPETGDDRFREAFESRVIPKIEDFNPEIMLVSSGFDAHVEDPLGNLSITDDTFTWLTELLVQLADTWCAGRLVSVLEGGYNLDVIRRCVREHVRLLTR